jgi:hypothetical protein
MVKAEGNTLDLAAGTIQLGKMMLAPLPTTVAAIAAREAAKKALAALQTAHEVTSKTFSEAEFASQLAADLGDTVTEFGLDALKDAEATALKAVEAAQILFDDAAARVTNLGPGAESQMLHGLTINDTQASLVFGPAGWKATHTGLHVNFGDSKAGFQPMGVSLDGPTIKLG